MRSLIQVSNALILMAILTSGCGGMKSSWKAAQRENTLEAYKAFLWDYPKSPYQAEAQAYVQYAEAERRYTVEAFEGFLKRFPESPYAEAARGQISSLRARDKRIQEALRRALGDGTQSEAKTVSILSLPAAYSIRAHLLGGVSVGDAEPRIRGDYGSHLKLEELVKTRCARILRALTNEEDWGPISEVQVSLHHGVGNVWVSLTSEKPEENASQTLYRISMPLETLSREDFRDMADEAISECWTVLEDKIPYIEVRPR